MKVQRILLVVSALLFICSIPAMAGSNTYSPEIQKVELQDDGSLNVTFTVLIESMWFCPGANGKKTGQDIELTFERALYNKSPKVDYPAKSVSKEAIAKVITIPGPFDSVSVRDGKKLTKIYPLAEEK